MASVYVKQWLPTTTTTTTDRFRVLRSLAVTCTCSLPTTNKYLILCTQCKIARSNKHSVVATWSCLICMCMLAKDGRRHYHACLQFTTKLVFNQYTKTWKLFQEPHQFYRPKQILETFARYFFSQHLIFNRFSFVKL